MTLAKKRQCLIFSAIESRLCFSHKAFIAQIDVTGFIDDNIESSRGTRLEPRIRTRSRPVSNAIDVKLRDDLTRLKNEILHLLADNNTLSPLVQAKTQFL